MNKWFDKFADRVADVWASPWWFILCLTFVIGWTAGLFIGSGKNVNSDVYHLWLNSPTTGLTFLGVFLLHNAQHRFEKATNERFEKLEDHLGVEDPVDDEGQKGQNA